MILTSERMRVGRGRRLLAAIFIAAPAWVNAQDAPRRSAARTRRIANLAYEYSTGRGSLHVHIAVILAAAAGRLV